MICGLLNICVGNPERVFYPCAAIVRGNFEKHFTPKCSCRRHETISGLQPRESLRGDTERVFHPCAAMMRGKLCREFRSQMLMQTTRNRPVGCGLLRICIRNPERVFHPCAAIMRGETLKRASPRNAHADDTQRSVVCGLLRMCVGNLERVFTPALPS